MRVIVTKYDEQSPFTTKDGSTIRSLLDLSNDQISSEVGMKFLCCCAPPYAHEDTYFE